MQVEEAAMVFEDDSPGPVEGAGSQGTQRNLSAWTISIPYVDFYEEEVKRERILVFCIDVERHDRKNGEEKFHHFKKLLKKISLLQ